MQCYGGQPLHATKKYIQELNETVTDPRTVAGEMDKAIGFDTAIVNYCGCVIEIVRSKDGYGAKVNHKILGQFDAPLEHYWFSNSHSALQAAKQLINTNSLLIP